MKISKQYTVCVRDPENNLSWTLVKELEDGKVNKSRNMIEQYDIIWWAIVVNSNDRCKIQNKKATQHHS